MARSISLSIYILVIFTPFYFSFQSEKPTRISTLNILSTNSESSNYQATGGGVKTIIQGLTSISNLLFGTDETTDRIYQKSSLTPLEVLNGVIGDFEDGYLFSGKIDAEIYDENCVFTDPTLSFKGLARFESNIKSLKPILDTFVGDTLVVLYDCQIDQNMNQITAQWRMSGGINLPWNPRIELTGNTVLSYDPDKNGRIVDYYESWDLPAATALFQLLQRSKIIGSKPTVRGLSTAGGGRPSTETVNVKKLKNSINGFCMDISDNLEVREASIAEGVKSLIKGSSKGALNPRNIAGVEGVSSVMSVETIAANIVENLQNEKWNLIYSSIKTVSQQSSDIENFLFKSSSKNIEFIDLISQGTVSTVSTVGPFAVQLASSCFQPNRDEAKIQISEKQLKVLTFLGFPLETSSASPQGSEGYKSWSLSYFDDDWRIFTSLDGNFFIIQK